MRLLLALLLAVALPASEPAKPETAPKARTKEEFVAALRACYDGKKDAVGDVCEIIADGRFGGGIWLHHGKYASAYHSACLLPGDVAPELTCAGWLNTAGGPPSLKDKVLWIEFSATWCGPCKQAMPRVQKLYEQFREKGLEVVVVTDEPAKVFAPYLRDHGYTMPASIGTGRDLINGRFGVTSWPTAILVGRDGKIAYLGDPRDEGLGKVIEGLLDAGPAASK